MFKLNRKVKFLLFAKFVLLQISVVLSGSNRGIRYIPHLVKIFNNGTYLCSGTVLADNFILTAGHCVSKVPPVRLTVNAGLSEFYEPSAAAKVSKLMLPKRYDDVTLDMDVAVLKLKSKLFTGKRTLVRAAKLCTKPWRQDDAVHVFGWGKIKRNCQILNLRAERVHLVANDKCSKYYQYGMRITNSKFCATAARPGGCLGDAGGPVIINGQLCGVVSWTNGCSFSTSPDVYINVLTARKFIVKALLQ